MLIFCARSLLENSDHLFKKGLFYYLAKAGESPNSKTRMKEQSIPTDTVLGGAGWGGFDLIEMHKLPCSVKHRCSMASCRHIMMSASFSHHSNR